VAGRGDADGVAGVEAGLPDDGGEVAFGHHGATSAGLGGRGPDGAVRGR
jgi:hypothetical protein